MVFNSEELRDVTLKEGMLIQTPAPKSILWIGDKYYRTSLPVDQHFNWLQKIMWKLCFGIKVEDRCEKGA